MGGAAVAGQLNQVAGAATRAGGGIGNMGNAAGAATKQSMSLGQRMTQVGLGFGMAASGAVGLISQLYGLERAQTAVEMAQKRVDVATRAVMTAQDAYAKAVATFGPNSRQAQEALLRLKAAHEQDAIATQRLTERQNDLNVQYLQFIAGLAPNLISIVGGLAMGFGGLAGKTSSITPAMDAATKSSRGLWTSLGLIGVVVGAGFLLYEALKNDWFGITDAFNQAGIAIGNALPFLRPLLTLIRDIGGAMGIGGKDAQNWKNDLGKAWSDVIEQLKGLWGAFVDAGQKMWGAMHTAVDQISHGDWKGAFATIGNAVFDLFNKYIQPTTDKISPAFGNAFKDLTKGDIIGSLKNLGLAIQDIYYKYAAPTLNKLSPAFTKAFQDLTKGDVMGALTQLGTAIMDVWTKHAEPMLNKLSPAFGKAFSALSKGDVIGGLTNLEKAIEDVYTKYVEPTLIKIAPAFTKTFQAIGKGDVVGALTSLGTTIAALYTKYVAPTLTTIATSFSKAFTQIGTAVAGILVTAGTAIGKAVTDWWKNNIETALNKFTKDAGPHGEKLGQAIATGIETAVNGFISWLTGIFFPKVGPSSASSALKSGTTMGTNMLGAIEDALKGFGVWIGPAFVRFIQDVIVPVGSAAAALAEGMLTAMEIILRDFGTWLLNTLLIPALKSAATGVATGAITIGKNILTGIGNGIGNIASWFATLIGHMVTDVYGAVYKAGQDIGTNIMNGIKNALTGLGSAITGGLGAFGKFVTGGGAGPTGAKQLGTSTITAQAIPAATQPASGGAATAPAGGGQYGPFAPLVIFATATEVAIVQTFTKMLKDLVGVFSLMTAAIQSFVRTAFINSLQTGVVNAGVAFLGAWKIMSITMVTVLTLMTSAIQTFVRTGLINSLQLGIVNAGVVFLNGWGIMSRTMVQVLSIMTSAVQTFVRTGLINSLEQGIVNAGTVFLKGWGTMSTTMVTVLGVMTSSIQNFVRTGLINSLQTGVNNAKAIVIAAFNSMNSGISSAMSSAASHVSSAVGSMRGSFSSLGSAANSAASQVRNLANAINALHDKTITLTTVFRTVGAPPAGVLFQGAAGASGAGGATNAISNTQTVPLPNVNMNITIPVYLDGLVLARVVKKNMFSLTGGMT